MGANQPIQSHQYFSQMAGTDPSRDLRQSGSLFNSMLSQDPRLVHDLQRQRVENRGGVLQPLQTANPQAGLQTPDDPNNAYAIPKNPYSSGTSSFFQPPKAPPPLAQQQQNPLANTVSQLTSKMEQMRTESEQRAKQLADQMKAEAEQEKKRAEEAKLKQQRLTERASFFDKQSQEQAAMMKSRQGSESARAGQTRRSSTGGSFNLNSLSRGGGFLSSISRR